MPESHDQNPRRSPSRDRHPTWSAANFGVPVLLALAVFVWLANSAGVLSSNDGSHLALARALILRGTTTIDPERALTLEVDLAEREGHAYSDRPPGTAFAALPAVWIGDRLDPAMFERALSQARAGVEIAPMPAPTPYIATYAKRMPPGSPLLAELIGTSLAIAAHAALVGALGLLLVNAALRELELERDARLFALACLAGATLWGPYSSALFSHVSAATAVSAWLLGVLVLEREGEGEASSTWVAALTGLAGAWAISCDYLLILAIVPATALTLEARRWPLILLGTVPVVAATLAYHHAAFGSPFAIGYDHQRNFAFARARGSTFSGSAFEGLWTLWGLGRGAGLLAQAPVVLLGLAAAPLITGARRRLMVLLLLGFVPWAVALTLHKTPWGGGTGDHRYLIPMLPLAAVGFAVAWSRLRERWPLRAGLSLVALASAVLVWRHFLAWHESEPFARLGFGAGAGLATLVIGLAALALRRKLRPAPLSC